MQSKRQNPYSKFLSLIENRFGFSPDQLAENPTEILRSFLRFSVLLSRFYWGERKMQMVETETEWPPIVPELPDDVAMECLIRVPHTCLAPMGGVSRRWRDLINGEDFYQERKMRGTSDGFACLIQQQIPPVRDSSPASEKSGPRAPPEYALTVFDPKGKSWERLPHADDLCGGLPLFCQCVAVDGKLILLGGWDNRSWEATRRVWVFDFRSQQWKRGKDMPAPARSFFAAGAGGGKVFVAGGHDEGKNALKTSAVYDVRRDEWEETGEMVEERDECEGMVVGKEFWVVSGYGTENQGRFAASADVLDTDAGTWRRVDDAWEAGRCIRSARIRIAGNTAKVNCVVGEGGNGAARVGRCVVPMGEGTAMVTGSAYEGGPVDCYMVESAKQGEVWTKVERPLEFGGFVQSGCFVEI